MSTVSGSTTTPGANTVGSAAKSYQDLDIDDFLNLMIAELQNQDPLNPMDNAQMMQQLSQIREIAATDKLTSTLDSLLVGQNLATASSMIGKTVRALADGKRLQGQVESVAVEQGAGGARELHVQISGQATAVTNAQSPASQVQLTAQQSGEAWNNVALAFVNDNSIVPGQEQALYDETSGQKVVVVRVRDGQSTAADVVAALNASSSVRQHFQASLLGSSGGQGVVRVEEGGLTAGGGRQSVKLDSVTDVFSTP